MNKRIVFGILGVASIIAGGITYAIGVEKEFKQLKINNKIMDAQIMVLQSHLLNTDHNVMDLKHKVET